METGHPSTRVVETGLKERSPRHELVGTIERRVVGLVHIGGVDRHLYSAP